jgi:cytochrome P450
VFGIILGSNVSNYRKLVTLYRVFRPLAGQGVFLAEGDEWRRQRRMLAPLFAPASIGLLLPHFFEAANALVRRLERSTTANLSEAFQEATLEAVLRALFSLPDNERRGRLAAMVRGYLDGPFHSVLAPGFASAQHSPSPKLKSLWQPCCRAFRLPWTIRAQCCRLGPRCLPQAMSRSSRSSGSEEATWTGALGPSQKAPPPAATSGY